MSVCRQCGHQNSAENPFCTNCGSKLDQSRAAEKPRQRNLKAKPVLFFVLFAVIVAAFTGYKLVEKKYSSEAAAAQFVKALETKDAATLKSMIVPTDSRVDVNDQSLKHLFALLDKNPAFIQEVEQSLAREDKSAPFFTTSAGRKYGLFKEHVIDANPYFLTVAAEGGQALVTMDKDELGTVKEEESMESGPYLAGLYTIQGTNKENKTEFSEDALLKGDETNVSVVLDMAAPEQEEEVQKETVVEKEVVYVPAETGDGYILPHSEYAYLSDGDLKGLSNTMLRLARNEIYARHGYIFESNELQRYFDGMAWYDADLYYDGTLSSIEKANVDLIKLYE